jgi:UDP-glucuronate 4-epimerase
MSPRTLLVTGGAGFIGSHLCERLLATSDARLAVLDNFDPFYERAQKTRNLAALAKNPRCELVELDLRDAPALEQLFARVRPAVVFHLAAKAGVRPSILAPGDYADVNIRGTLNLLELCKRHQTRDFIFASSSSVYGNAASVPFRETDSVDHPISPYAATKKAAELLCHTYHHLHGQNVAALRFFTVYGPRQRPDLAIHSFAKKILAGEPITLFGDGQTSRDYTYIDDIIDGVLGAYAWCTKQTAPAYVIANLGNSSPVTLSELVKQLEAALGKKAVVRHAPMQEGDVERTFAEISRAKELFAYAPKVPLEEGLRRFVGWLRASAS